MKARARARARPAVYDHVHEINSDVVTPCGHSTTRPVNQNQAAEDHHENATNHELGVVGESRIEGGCGKTKLVEASTQDEVESYRRNAKQLAAGW